MELFTITENDANQRLDKFLKKLLVNASVSLIYKCNRKNKVKINGKREDNEYKLQMGDVIKLFLTEDEFALLTKKNPQPNSLPVGEGGKRVQFDIKNIVYEDGDILVINKPAGINVHPGDHKTKESNIIAQIQDYLWNKLNSLTFKPSLVHRIDRDTSWILIIWKKKDILSKLVEDFKWHKKVKKIYYAIVIWKLPSKTWTIDAKLLRIEWAKNEDKVQVSENGQTAITHYTVIREYPLKTKEWEITLSEVEVEILTGRMHQIRVHFASLGTPILWDDKYGNKQFNAYIAKNYWLTRQALHAWKIEFFHYGRDKKIALEANIKEDLKEFIKKIS